MIRLGTGVCVAALLFGTGASASAGRLAIEYGGWEKQPGSCRAATASGSRGRTPLPQVAPGVAPSQECRYCRTVRRCTVGDAVRHPIRCATSRDCTGHQSSPPPSGRGGSLG